MAKDPEPLVVTQAEWDKRDRALISFRLFYSQAQYDAARHRLDTASIIPEPPIPIPKQRAKIRRRASRSRY